MKLFYYEHCPFCVRVLMLAHFKKLDIEKIVLPNDDEETPISMIGQKMLPILQKSCGNYMPESLDIIQHLDALGTPILPPHYEPEGVIEWLNRAKPLMRKLTYPRFVNPALKEFKTEAARNYFERKKSKSIGSFAQLIEQTPELVKAFQPIFNELSDYILDMINNSLTWEDIYLFPYVLSLTLVPGLEWAPATQQYLETKCALFDIKAYLTL